MSTRPPLTLTEKLIQDHLVDGTGAPGEEAGLAIDQTLTQDATGTLVMLELEAMGLDRVRTKVSAQYVDHNLLQTDYKNADDHVFLRSACQRFGIWFSRPGNGVSHPVHQERFGVPGQTLVGSDSHTPAAGAIGMLALGAGGLDVAMAMAGEPLRLRVPQVFGVKLVGELPPWCSAKDVILEMLRRHDVDGGRGYIFEYFGPGLEQLSVMDRHVIANMGTELGATSTVFPSDGQTLRYLSVQGRKDAWTELQADDEARYHRVETLDLSALQPLIALPGSPGNVVPVTEVAGRPIYQAYLGSSANPGFRDFWVPAQLVEGQEVPPQVSFDINPSSRYVLNRLLTSGALGALLAAGARLHQTGCNGCIGMGQAPATGRISLRTVPRNFPGRSGTREDQVYLCSPETATASALLGEITDPRTLPERLGIEWPSFHPEIAATAAGSTHVTLSAPDPDVELHKGPNIVSLPPMEPLQSNYRLPVLLKMGDHISTDEILPAGAEVLPLRSNVPAISRYAFGRVDQEFVPRAEEAKREHGGHVVVAGENYAQGSSREHAALAPRYLGQVAVLAKSYARIGWQNLVNFGILPLELVEEGDYDRIRQGDVLAFDDLRSALGEGDRLEVENTSKGERYTVRHTLSERQLAVVLAGGVINHHREQPPLGA